MFGKSFHLLKIRICYSMRPRRQLCPVKDNATLKILPLLAKKKYARNTPCSAMQNMQMLLSYRVAERKVREKNEVEKK